MYSLQSLLDINNKLAATQTRLASGKRINSAADDPAGLTIATKMKARSEGSGSGGRQHQRRVEHVIGSRIRVEQIIRHSGEDALESHPGRRATPWGRTERQTIQSQLSAFAEQIDDIISETKWNGVQLLDGTVSKTFQTGVDAGETTEWALSQKHDALTLGVANQNSVAKFSNVGYVPGSFDGSSQQRPVHQFTVERSDGVENRNVYGLKCWRTAAAQSGTFLSMDSQYIDGISGASATAFGSGNGTGERPVFVGDHFLQPDRGYGCIEHLPVPDHKHGHRVCSGQCVQLYGHEHGDRFKRCVDERWFQPGCEAGHYRPDDGGATNSTLNMSSPRMRNTR